MVFNNRRWTSFWRLPDVAITWYRLNFDGSASVGDNDARKSDAAVVAEKNIVLGR